jgi:glycosyltransferase involved in cell wall biosynthesis
MAWQTNEIEDFHQKMEFKAEVVFLDYISHEDLPLITGAALVLTYISLFEGFGIPIVEALACNVPVLTSNVSSMPEVVGEAGIKVSPTDVGAIVAGMKSLAFDETIRQKCIANAPFQKNKFDWAASAEKMYQVLVQMMV